MCLFLVPGFIYSGFFFNQRISAKLNKNTTQRKDLKLKVYSHVLTCSVVACAQRVCTLQRVYEDRSTRK